MMEALAHRARAGRGAWTGEGASMAQGLLHPVPGAAGAPAVSEDGSLVAVIDGRIENAPDLRAILGGPADDGDAALVLAAYARWGADGAARLEGDFAFAVWDARRRELSCARDRMGHKPFYYCRVGSRFAFASELPALLLLPWAPREVNEGVLAEMLAGDWLSRDETLWEGILRLPAAHRMKVTASGMGASAYWRPFLDDELPHRTDEAFAAH